MAGESVLCSFFFSSRRRHTRLVSDWSSDVCSSDLLGEGAAVAWLSERFAQQLAGRLGPRVMSLNFDNWVFDIEGGLRRVLAHLSLPADLAAGLACSSVLTRYVQMPDDHTYSAMLRRRLA